MTDDTPTPIARAAENAGEFSRGVFVALVAVLLGLGTVMVHSASITSRPTDFERVYLWKHVLFVALGVAGAIAASFFPVRAWKTLSPWAFGVAILLLIAVLIPGIGTEVNGARRWLRFGGFSLQPSELAKLTLPILLATLVTRRSEDSPPSWWRATFPPLLPIVLVVPLVLVEPDLGNSLFLVTIAGVALFLGGWPIRNFVVAGGLAIPAAVSLVVLRPYQLRRITGFLDTWSDFEQAPYQVKQSLVTLGSGGLFGVGLGRGWQKLSFLPEANTDFVFAVVGEELGLVGTLGLVTVWLALLVLGLRMVSRPGLDPFARIVATTMLVQVVLQAALNVAVVIAMVPPKGIPHPLVSYGGSNLVCTLTALGLVYGLTRSRPANAKETATATATETAEEPEDETASVETGDESPKPAPRRKRRRSGRAA